jgi:hypothetical protein
MEIAPLLISSSLHSIIVNLKPAFQSLPYIITTVFNQ